MPTPQPSSKATLSKVERIKSLKTIDELFKNGSSFFLHPLKIIYCTLPDKESVSKAAFMVSKRHFKKSVDRNRIKRIMRDVWRKQHRLLLNPDEYSLQVILIYTAQHLPTHLEISTAVAKGLQRIKERTSS
jgi:ribonuclease P protein component